MISKYKLCITIPTYNREKYLKRLLNSIISQESFSNEISVVINDWPSKDDTEKMVKEFQKQYKNIFYYRNEKAVWMLPAILESMEMSNWEYTRLFWSDDFMASNALWHILQCINKYNSKVIYTGRNEVSFWNKLAFQNSETKMIQFKWMSEFSIYLWDKKKWTFHDKSVLFTFMSVFCVNSNYYEESFKNLIENIWYNKYDLDRNYFNFNLVALSNITKNDIISFIVAPASVYCEIDNHWWIPNKKIFKDLKYLTNFITKKYEINFLCKIFFWKLNLHWWLICYIVPKISSFLKKIWLFDPILKLYKRIFY